MSHVTATHRAINATKVFCPQPTTGGTRQHMNAKRLPTDALAKTDFKYMNTDASDAGAYLKA